MGNRVFTFVVVLFVFAAGSISAQASCEDFNKLLDKTYNFKPSKLTSEQIDAKSNELDVVWNQVKTNRNLIPCLLEATKVRKDDKFFRFNASNLLISISDTEDGRKFLLEAYGEVDLADINLRFWIPYIVTYGVQGLDTSAAGDNWMRFPDPKYYLPQHGTRAVNKSAGAVIIYGSMDEKFATPALAKIANDKVHPGREMAVDLLMQQVTSESIKALIELDQTGISESLRNKIKIFLSAPSLKEKRQGEPKTTREEYLNALNGLVSGKPIPFMELAAKVTDGERDAIAVLKAEDVPLVRKSRRFWASTGTPHAPEWYQAFTDILMAMVWKTELEKAKGK